MNRKSALVALALITVLTALPLTTVLVNATCLTADEYKYGPRSDELLMKFYSDVEDAYGALKAGEIDMMMYDITYEQYFDAIADPNIQVCPGLGGGINQFDFNNNWTIPSYSDARNPLSNRSFRQAMAHLIDKDYFIQEICEGFAARIDVPMSAPCSDSWRNQSLTGENYPYPYDPEKAAELLDQNGFAQGSNPNSYYDPDSPRSAEYIRVYPEGWPKEGEDIDPLICCPRTDDRRRYEAGQLLISNLRKSGIPCVDNSGTMAELFAKVMGEMDYHFYIGGWSSGYRFPPLHLYHSDNWFPYGPNYVTGMNESNLPNYPEIDEVVQAVYSTESLDDSMAASKKAQGLMIEECISVWLWSSKYFRAYLNLLGVVNMDGWGPENYYSFLNMYSAAGGAIKVGLIHAPDQMNVLCSWWYDWQVLERIYDGAAFSLAPYDIAKEQPWTVQDWSVGEWHDMEDGVNKTKVTVWFKEGVNWINPVTGDVYGEFTSHDYAFTVRFILGYPYAWHYYDHADVHHIKIVDDHCVEVFMEEKSFWLQYAAFTMMVVPRKLWQRKFCFINSTTVVLDKNYSICDKLHLRPYIYDVDMKWGEGQILEVVDCTLDGETLTQDMDFEICMLHPTKPGVRPGGDSTYFHWLRPAYAGQELVITYWTPDPAKPSPDGYWPGNYPWQEIAVGMGQWYLVDFMPGIGGHATFKANRHYWLETPPLGETDWIWEWGPRDTDRPLGGPRCGNYTIDIGDVVLCTAAYRSHGNTYPPDDNWFAAADQTPPEGFIDISDVVSITGRYRITFGGWSQPLNCTSP